MEGRHLRPLGYYLLAQAPGWLVVILLGLAARELWRVRWWAVVAFVLLWIAKDLALYPHMRRWYLPVDDPPAPRPGARGSVRTALEPEGMVRVRGELWRARSTGAHLPAGTEILVCGRAGLRLEVRSAREVDDEEGDAPPGPV